MITKKNINIPIFRLKLKIVVVDDIEEALEIDTNINTEADPLVIDHNNGTATVVIASNDMSVISHECLHVKNAVWNRIGYSPNPVNDEVDAYLVGYLFDQVSKVVAKHNLETQC